MKEIKNKLPLSAEKNEPFKVPAHYFDTLPGRIQDRISATHKNKTVLEPVFQVFTRKIVWIPSFAAALIIAAIFFVNPGTKMPSDTMSKADTTLTNTIDINTSYALEAQYMERAKVVDQINTMSNESLNKEVKSLPDDINKKDIVIYLKDEGIDPFLLADL